MTAVAAKRSRIAQENEFVNTLRQHMLIDFELTFRNNDNESIDGLYNIY
jgi:hypothetical protein